MGYCEYLGISRSPFVLKTRGPYVELPFGKRLQPKLSHIQWRRISSARLQARRTLPSADCRELPDLSLGDGTTKRATHNDHRTKRLSNPLSNPRHFTH